MRLRLNQYIPHTPTPPQIAFLTLNHQEAFYGGAAGGGKSDALLMAALQYVDVPGYAALILRRTFRQLALPDAIMARSHEWLTRWRPGVHWNDDRKTWTFPSGATLTFGYLDNEKDVYNYQGAAFQFVGFDELTQFSEDQYTYLFSRLRKLSDVEVPVRVRSASNPGGIGHGWVKKRFITERNRNVVFIPAKLADNPHLDLTSYAQSLSNLSPVLQQQLLDGDWGAFEGAAYPDFDEHVHVVQPFLIPREWDRFEHMDFGVNNPTAWHATATDYDGNLIVYGEYYSPGLVSKHAGEIKELRKRWWPTGEDGWRDTSPVCFADPSIRNRTGGETRLGDPASILTEFADHGLSLALGNNNPRAGYQRVAQLLKVEPGRVPPVWSQLPADHDGAPRLYISNTCTHLIDQLKSAPIRPFGEQHGGEMIDPKWESSHGHAHASLRYGVMSRPEPTKQPLVEAEDPREALIRRRLAKRDRADTHTYVEI